LRLLVRGPYAAARTLAVAEARPIERDHAMPLGEPVDDAAHHEVLEPNGVPVQEHERRAAAAIDVVQTHAVHGHELADRRMRLLRLVRAALHPPRRRRERNGSDAAVDEALVGSLGHRISMPRAGGLPNPGATDSFVGSGDAGWTTRYHSRM